MFWHKRPIYARGGGLPQYRQGPQYDLAGAEIFVYEPPFTNPLFLVRGAGYRAGSLNPIGAPPIFSGYALPKTKLTGPGFIVPSQIVSQPLTEK